MHHAEIFCLLMKRNVTMVSIARQEDVSPSVVTEVIRGKKTSFAVATAIAVKVDRSLTTLWPGKYDHRISDESKAA
ncbi:MAG: helix-turn-helix domain-containing protein [Methylophaga sp.]|nr:helix-turn-helix domain-containing protein [Methylophaga sp.]